MTEPEDLRDEIGDKVTLWLATHIALVRDAHDENELVEVEAKLRKYLNESSYTDKTIREADVNLRERVEIAYVALHRVNPR